MERSKDNPVRDKSYFFALNIIKLYQYLVKEEKEFVLSKQVLKVGLQSEQMLKKRLVDNPEKIF